MRNLLTHMGDRAHGNARLADLPLGWVRPSEENDHLSCQAAPSCRGEGLEVCDAVPVLVSAGFRRILSLPACACALRMDHLRPLSRRAYGHLSPDPWPGSCSLRL